MVETHKQAVKRGKKSRASGADFERRVREDLEEKGWIVDRWTNNIEFQKENSIEVSGKIGGPFGKLIPAKAKWNNFTKTMIMGKGGMPDFIAFKKDFLSIDADSEPTFKEELEESIDGIMFEKIDKAVIIGVECKSNGYLTKEERAKCQWLINDYVFSKILIARKTKVKNRIVIEYKEFE